MSKSLKELSLEELWELFPILLKPYNADYPFWYSEEEKTIKHLLKTFHVQRINHIGSTAIPHCLSKPCIDILVECDLNADIDAAAKQLEDNGWIIMHHEEKTYVLNKGYTEKGFAEKVFHCHLRYYDDWHELYFRDYLLENPKVVVDYENLKNELSKRYKYHRDNYTQAKTSFIQMHTEIAKERYKDRYLPR